MFGHSNPFGRGDHRFIRIWFLCILSNKIPSLPHDIPRHQVEVEQAIEDEIAPPGNHTVKAVLEEAIQQLAETPEAWDRMSQDACILHLRPLLNPTKKFVQKARECEGFLSKAQLTQGHGMSWGGAGITQLHCAYGG